MSAYSPSGLQKRGKPCQKSWIEKHIATNLSPKPLIFFRTRPERFRHARHCWRIGCVQNCALSLLFQQRRAIYQACTEFVLEPHSLYGIDSTSPLPEDKEQAIVQLIKTLDSRFKGEMTVVLDYVKNRDSRDIANDELLKMADNQFLVELSKIVGREHANQAYALLLGGLMTRLLNGNQTKVEEIASWILQLSTRESS